MGLKPAGTDPNRMSELERMKKDPKGYDLNTPNEKASQGTLTKPEKKK